MFKFRRVYAPPDPEDGFRVLIDRLWPRGLSKANAHGDVWMKDVAPSEELRKWFDHDPKRWAEFERRYKQELRGKTEETDALRKLEREHGRVTLLFGAKDEERNNAVVLAEKLNAKKLKKQS